MSWLGDLRDIAGVFDEEFGTKARIIPMIARPNRRSEIDESRAIYEICGVYHEAYKPMGDGRRNTDGLSETSISSQTSTFSAAACVFAHPPTQGDVVSLLELHREFRILDVRHEIIGRTLLVLEDVQAPRR